MQFNSDKSTSSSGTDSVQFGTIETDYKDFIQAETKVGRLPKITNLMTILKIIKSYVDTTGLTLRQVFEKQKAGESDAINQYQFTKIITKIVGQKGQNFGIKEIEDNALQMLMNKVSVLSGGNNFGQTMSMTMAKDKTADINRKHVSFQLLVILYNDKLGLKESVEDSMIPQQLAKLLAEIAKVALDNQKQNLDLKQHFGYPQCMMDQFLRDLDREPFNCLRHSTITILEELGKKYGAGNNRVNTQTFILEVESLVEREREKNSLFTDIRKQIQLKNLKIETVFIQAMPEISKFQLEYLTVEEFFNVFLFLQCKNASIKEIRDMLSNMLQPNEQGRYSYVEFVNEYKSTDPTPAQARRGRRLYTSKEEILKRISYVIEHRGMKNFGSLLADQQTEGRLEIPRDSFYRVIDSLQFALGEGDIQELIKEYSKSGQFVDTARFKDDLNIYIINPDYQIQLKSVLNALLAGRVVDHIDDETPRNQSKVDPKLLSMFKLIAKEVYSGLFIRDTDVQGWFPRYGSYKRGCLTIREFQSALEQLDVFMILERPEQSIQAYYDNMVSRQASTIGYEETLLLIDQLSLFLTKDSNVSSRQRMVEDILNEIAGYLFENKIPILDVLEKFDTQRSQQMYRSDFYTTFLDNFLRLQFNARTCKGLSLN